MNAPRELRVASLWPAPFLRTWTAPAVEDFKHHLTRYRSDRGEARVVDLISEDLLLLIQTVHPTFADESESRQLEFLCGVRPRRSDDIVEKLQGLRMKGPGLESYLVYASNFLKLCKDLPLGEDDVRDSKVVRRSFRQGIEPVRVSRRLELRLEAMEGRSREVAEVIEVGEVMRNDEHNNSPEVETLAERPEKRKICKLSDLMSLALELVREEDQAKELLGQSARGANLATQAGSNMPGGGRATQSGRTVRCRNCGRMGHFARECWSTRKNFNVDSSRARPDEPKRELQQERSPVSARPVNIRANTGCFFCKQPGHRVAECPRLKQLGESAYRRTDPVVTRSSSGKMKAGDVKRLQVAGGDTPCRVQINVGPKQRKYWALVDTGTNHSFVSTDVFHQLLEEDGSTRINSELHVTTGTGQSVSTEAAVLVDVDLGPTVEEFVLHELPGMPDEVIIGIEDLWRVGLDFSPRNSQIVVRQDLVGEVQDDLYEQLVRSEEEEEIRKAIQQRLGEQDMTSEFRERVGEVLNEYLELFGSLPKEGSRLLPHSITLKEGAVPVAQPLRRLSPEQAAAVREEISKLLGAKIIRPSSSPWATPVVLVRKRNGKWRMCQDFRELNALTVRNMYPLPRMDDLFDALHGKKIFAVIDMNSGYYQTRMEEGDVEKTAFIVPEGLYEYLRMPFGLMGAPSTFQRGMNEALSDLRWRACLGYLDDIIVFGVDEEDFLAHLRQVLQRLQEWRIRLNLEKSKFGVSKVTFLGQKVTPEGRTIDPQRLQGLRNMEEPTTVRMLKAFLGVINFYRGYIDNLANVAEPLYSLLKKNVNFRWTPRHKEAFDMLKEKLLKAPILAHPDFEKTFVLRTDASDVGIGCTLLQEGNPILFLSRTLTTAERNWVTHEQEAFAIVWSVRKLRTYLLDRHFVIETDHQNLRYIQSCRNAKVQRWRLELAEYDFEIRHISGEENQLADAMSRLCVLEEEHPADPEELMGFDEMKVEAQRMATEEEKKHWHEDEDFFYNQERELWFKKGEGVDRVVVPEAAVELKARLCVLTHAHVLAGHFGAARMEAALKQGVYWKGMKRDIEAFIRRCPKCQKKGGIRRQGPLLSTNTSKPMEVWHVDFVGPLEETVTGNSYLLVMVDRFSRFVEIYPCPRADAAAAVAGILSSIICRHGIPDKLVSDGGSHFCNALLEEVCTRLKIVHHVVIPYHPEANGAVERQNQVVMATLRAMIPVEDRWDESVMAVQFAMNAAVSKPTGVSPFELMYGRKPSTPLTQWVAGLQPAVKEWGEMTETEKAQEWIWRMHALWASAGEVQTKMQEDAVRNYESKSIDPAYGVGDLVLVQTRRRENKLAFRWRGPMRVKKFVNPVVVVVSDLVTGEEDKVHVSRLKLFVVDDMDDRAIMEEALPRGEYIVERVVNHDCAKGVLRLLIQWLGWEEQTWEPAQNLLHVDVVSDYLKRHGLEGGR